MQTPGPKRSHSTDAILAKNKVKDRDTHPFQTIHTDSECFLLCPFIKLSDWLALLWWNLHHRSEVVVFLYRVLPRNILNKKSVRILLRLIITVCKRRMRSRRWYNNGWWLSLCGNGWANMLVISSVQVKACEKVLCACKVRSWRRMGCKSGAKSNQMP